MTTIANPFSNLCFFVCRPASRSLLVVVGVLCVVASGCGTPFQARDHISLTAPLPAEKLVVRTDFGDIVVRSDANLTEIRAEATLIGKGSTPAEAEKALGEIRVSLEPKEGESAIVVAAGEHPRSGMTRRYAVQWHITAPPDIVIEARTEFGDVEVDRFNSGVTVETAFGEIEVDAAGPLELVTAFGDIELRVRAANPGDVRVATEFGDVDVELPQDRAGRVLADTDFGSVNAHFGAVPIRLLRARSHHFDAELAGSATPLLDVTTEFGDVDIRTHKTD